MRSLMSSNPFEPAKESLVALFDEIRKKVRFRTFLHTYLQDDNQDSWEFLIKTNKKFKILLNANNEVQDSGEFREKIMISYLKDYLL